jgi:hypothetical protein
VPVYSLVADVSGADLSRRQIADMRRSYVRVLAVWVATLLALYALQEYFS